MRSITRYARRRASWCGDFRESSAGRRVPWRRVALGLSCLDFGCGRGRTTDGLPHLGWCGLHRVRRGAAEGGWRRRSANGRPNCRRAVAPCWRCQARRGGGRRRESCASGRDDSTVRSAWPSRACPVRQRVRRHWSLAGRRCHLPMKRVRVPANFVSGVTRRSDGLRPGAGRPPARPRGAGALLRLRCWISAGQHPVGQTSVASTRFETRLSGTGRVRWQRTDALQSA